MTGQEYLVIADRDKGDDPQHIDVQAGDRYTLEAVEGFPSDDQVVRIERPVPTADEPWQKTVPDGVAFGEDVPSDQREFAATSQFALPASQDQPPSVPTREQIAAVFRRWWDQQQTNEVVEDGAGADAVLALLNGADR